MPKLILLFLILSGFTSTLVACGSNNQLQPEIIPTPLPTDTPKPTNTPTPTSTATPTPEPVIVTFNYHTSDIIRSTPNLERSGIATIQPGDTLFILGYMEARYKIYLVRTSDGKEGWLFWKIGMFEPLEDGQVPNASFIPIPTMTRPASTNGAGSSRACSCSRDSYNCEDFNSQSAAQACLNSCSTDIHNLDSDNDGTACEE